MPPVIMLLTSYASVCLSDSVVDTPKRPTLLHGMGGWTCNLMWALVLLTFLSFAITEGMETDTQISTMDLDSFQPGTLGIEAY